MLQSTTEPQNLNKPCFRKRQHHHVYVGHSAWHNVQLVENGVTKCCRFNQNHGFTWNHWEHFYTAYISGFTIYNFLYFLVLNKQYLCASKACSSRICASLLGGQKNCMLCPTWEENKTTQNATCVTLFILVDLLFFQLLSCSLIPTMAYLITEQWSRVQSSNTSNLQINHSGEHVNPLRPDVPASFLRQIARWWSTFPSRPMNSGSGLLQCAIKKHLQFQNV